MLTTAVLAGCGEQAEISTYSVPKQIESRLPKERRMLAAIVPRGSRAWFFKLTGTDAFVAEQDAAFRKFLGTVRFSESSLRPKWKLPKGWRQLPDNAPQNRGTFRRYATLQIQTEQEILEISITTLPWPDNELLRPSYLLNNINRWRKQLSLPEIDTESLADHSEQLEVDGETAYFTSFSGLPNADSSPRRPPPGPTVEQPKRQEGLEYDKPENWNKTAGTSFSRAAFEVAEGDKSIQITVSALAAAGGERLPNINRWRGQLGLAEITEDQLKDEMKEIQIDGLPGDYVALIGEQKALFGVIVEQGPYAWFFKLIGDKDLAAREKASFENFVKSVRFGS